CGNSATGVTLGPGRHNLVTATAAFSGFELDSLWLSSASGGAALALTPAGAIPSTAAPITPATAVLHQDRSHVDVRVTGTGTPYWLVLGQSQSAGWRASIQGGASLGASTLIDGYANGWLISGAADRGTRAFDLSWTPQKVVDAALLASGATLAISVGLVVVPTSWLARAWVDTGRLVRRRRRPWRRTSRPGEPEPSPHVPPGDEEVSPVAVSRRARLMAMVAAIPRALPRWRRGGSEADATATSPETVPAVTTEAAATIATEPTGPEPVVAPAGHDAPVLMSLFTSRGRRPRWLGLILAALATGAAAGAVSAPLAAPIVAGAVLFGCLVPWSRLVFVLAPFGLLAATGAYMVVEQDRHRYLSNIGWPEQFPIANTLTWMAVSALVAGAVVETARWRGWLAGDEFIVRYWRKTKPPEEPVGDTAGAAVTTGETAASPVAEGESAAPGSKQGAERTTEGEPSDDGGETVDGAAMEAHSRPGRPGLGARVRSWLTAPLRWSKKRRTDTLSAQSEAPSGEQASDHHP
ncbi:MAG: hypothetical protein ACRDYB_01420, partial [Acidimicrobiales bacterium]